MTYRATTGQDGTYEAIGLEPGDYLVMFDPTRANQGPEFPFLYETALLDNRFSEASADVLSIGVEEQRTGVDAVLREAVGTVAGHVHDQLGNPISGVDVRVSRFETLDGGGEGEGGGVLGGSNRTCSPPRIKDGYYFFPRVHAGDLRVRFVAPNAELAGEWFLDNRHVESLADTVALATGEDLASSTRRSRRSVT